MPGHVPACLHVMYVGRRVSLAGGVWCTRSTQTGSASQPCGVQGEQWQTPLWMAACNGHTAVVAELLRRSEAELNLADEVRVGGVD
jgi:hypothetical protein